MTTIKSRQAAPPTKALSQPSFSYISAILHRHCAFDTIEMAAVRCGAALNMLWQIGVITDYEVVCDHSGTFVTIGVRMNVGDVMQHYKIML